MSSLQPEGTNLTALGRPEGVRLEHHDAVGMDLADQHYVGDEREAQPNSIVNAQAEPLPQPEAPVFSDPPWRQGERDALKRCLLAFGAGRWREIRAALTGAYRGSNHTIQAVETACWELLAAVRPLVDESDARYIDHLWHTTARAGAPQPTQGAPWLKVESIARAIVKRLRMLETFQHSMASLENPRVLRSFTVAIAGMPDSSPPAVWWSADADLALLRGVFKHGYSNYDPLRVDPEFAAAFVGAFKAAPTIASRNVLALSDAPAAGDLSDSGVTAQDKDTTEPMAASCNVPAAIAQIPCSASVWPGNDILTRRFKRLSDYLTKSVRAVAVKDEQQAAQSAVWTKRDRLELVKQLMIWGAPASVIGLAYDDEEEEVAACDGSGSSVAQVLANAAWLQLRASSEQLARRREEHIRAVVGELVVEMEEAVQGMARGGRKARHQSDCQCVVCNNRRRGEARRQAVKEELGPVSLGEALVEGARRDNLAHAPQHAEGVRVVAAVAEGGALAHADGQEGEDEEEDMEEEEEKEAEEKVEEIDSEMTEDDLPKETKEEGGVDSAPAKKNRSRRGHAKVLTGLMAVRLRDRLALLALLRRGVAHLRTGWASAAAALSRMGELPLWWGPEMDEAFASAVIRHGFGNWLQIMNDNNLPFKATALAHAQFIAQRAAEAQAEGCQAEIKKEETGEGKTDDEKPAVTLREGWEADAKSLTKRAKQLGTAMKRLLRKPQFLRNAALRGPGDRRRALQLSNGHVQDNSPAAVYAMSAMAAAEALAATRGIKDFNPDDEEPGTSAARPGVEPPPWDRILRAAAAAQSSYLLATTGLGHRSSGGGAADGVPAPWPSGAGPGIGPGLDDGQHELTPAAESPPLGQLSVDGQAPAWGPPNSIPPAAQWQRGPQMLMRPEAMMAQQLVWAQAQPHVLDQVPEGWPGRRVAGPEVMPPVQPVGAVVLEEAPQLAAAPSDAAGSSGTGLPRLQAPPPAHRGKRVRRAEAPAADSTMMRRHFGDGHWLGSNVEPLEGPGTSGPRLWPTGVELGTYPPGQGPLPGTHAIVLANQAVDKPPVGPGSQEGWEAQPPQPAVEGAAPMDRPVVLQSAPSGGRGSRSVRAGRTGPRRGGGPGSRGGRGRTKRGPLVVNDPLAGGGAQQSHPRAGGVQHARSPTQDWPVAPAAAGPSSHNTSAGAGRGSGAREEGSRRAAEAPPPALSASNAAGAGGLPEMPMRLNKDQAVLDFGAGQVWVVQAYPGSNTQLRLYPEGYRSTVVYNSVSDPSALCAYLCEVRSEGGLPVFVVLPMDTPSVVAADRSPDGAWATIAEMVAQKRNRRAEDLDGHDMFGLSHPSVVNVLVNVLGAGAAAAAVTGAGVGAGEEQVAQARVTVDAGSGGFMVAQSHALAHEGRGRQELGRSDRPRGSRSSTEGAQNSRMEPERHGDLRQMAELQARENKRARESEYDHYGREPGMVIHEEDIRGGAARWLAAVEAQRSGARPNEGGRGGAVRGGPFGHAEQHAEPAVMSRHGLDLGVADQSGHGLDQAPAGTVLVPASALQGGAFAALAAGGGFELRPGMQLVQMPVHREQEGGPPAAVMRYAVPGGWQYASAPGEQRETDGEWGGGSTLQRPSRRYSDSGDAAAPAPPIVIAGNNSAAQWAHVARPPRTPPPRRWEAAESHAEPLSTASPPPSSAAQEEALRKETVELLSELPAEQRDMIWPWLQPALSSGSLDLPQLRALLLGALGRSGGAGAGAAAPSGGPSRSGAQQRSSPQVSRPSTADRPPAAPQRQRQYNSPSSPEHARHRRRTPSPNPPSRRQRQRSPSRDSNGNDPNQWQGARLPCSNDGHWVHVPAGAEGLMAPTTAADGRGAQQPQFLFGMPVMQQLMQGQFGGGSGVLQRQGLDRGRSPASSPRSGGRWLTESDVEMQRRGSQSSRSQQEQERDSRRARSPPPAQQQPQHMFAAAPSSLQQPTTVYLAPMGGQGIGTEEWLESLRQGGLGAAGYGGAPILLQAPSNGGMGQAQVIALPAGAVGPSVGQSSGGRAAVTMMPQIQGGPSGAASQYGGQLVAVPASMLGGNGYYTQMPAAFQMPGGQVALMQHMGLPQVGGGPAIIMAPSQGGLPAGAPPGSQVRWAKPSGRQQGDWDGH